MTTTKLATFFFFAFHLVSGQKTEQIALNFLLANIPNQTIKFEDGLARFNPENNKVWYFPKVLCSRTKVSIPHAYKAKLEWFYKVVHDSHDIHIRTSKAKKNTAGYAVSFTITSTYNNFTNFEVTLDREKRLLSVKRTE